MRVPAPETEQEAGQPPSRSARRRSQSRRLTVASWRSRYAALAQQWRAKRAEWLTLAEPALRPTRRVLDCVTGLGWLVLAAVGVSWLLAGLFGWREFGYAASVLLALFALSCLLTLSLIHISEPTRPY